MNKGYNFFVTDQIWSIVTQQNILYASLCLVRIISIFQQMDHV